MSFGIRCTSSRSESLVPIDSAGLLGPCSLLFRFRSGFDLLSSVFKNLSFRLFLLRFAVNRTFSK